jgi:hypothetical protein
MEEASRDILGQTGDLVFTEGEEITKPLSQAASAHRTKGRPSKKRRVDTD